MDQSIRQCLILLGDYDTTIHYTYLGVDRILDDPSCDEEAKSMAIILLIALLFSKAELLLPDSDKEEEELLNEAIGADEVMRSLPDPAPLLSSAVIGYAIAMSCGRWGWEPWSRVRDILLEQEVEDN